MDVILLLLMVIAPGWSLGVKDIVIIVLSQENEHHLRVAESLKSNLYEQAEALQQGQPVVHLSHKDFSHVGDWTILPIIPRLSNLHGANSSWLFFIEDRTQIRLKELLEVLNKHNCEEPIWLGHALYDKEATIIHHFAFYENPQHFKYPNMASGVAISTSLFKSLSHRLKENSHHNDFGIDSGHELALFIWNKGKGQVLKHASALCIKEGPHCAAFPTPFQPCGRLVEKESIYFAVKTCQKFHKDRLSVVKNTWAKHADKIEFFSDVADKSVPTISLGVPNTEQGHCSKTMAILRYIASKFEKFPEIKWIVIADDDTILGVSRLQQLLTCYDASTPVALGERYGYNVHNPRGYNYVTGGGGMVFSKTLVEQLTQPGICECPSINAPDDMYLGLCIASLGVSVTHSPLFHQARPVDYSPGYLSTNDAVSFHKHWMIDPINVYQKWFIEDDLKLTQTYDVHKEL